MNETIEIIKIGGPAVATAALFLYYIDRMDKRVKNLIENHLSHVTEAINKNTQVLERLTVTIDSFNKRRKRK